GGAVERRRHQPRLPDVGLGHRRRKSRSLRERGDRALPNPEDSHCRREQTERETFTAMRHRTADAAKRPANHLVQHRDDEESCQSGYYDYPQPLWTREQCGDVGDEAEIPIQIDLTTVER